MKLLAPLIAVVLLLLPGGAAVGAERFPPPQFESGYKLPEAQYPAQRADVYEYIDVAVLLAALALASWLVLRTRSRRAVFGLMAFSLLYFGFWRRGCVCSIGAIQNVTLALFDTRYAIPLTVIAFFVLPLGFTLLFGRTFCAAVCPLGAMQDLVLFRPVRVPRWLESGLRVLPFLYLGAAVVFAALAGVFIICEYDPFVAFFRLTGGLNMLILGGCILAMAVFVGRPYCRYLCPLGAVLGVLSRASWRRVTITPAECVKCRLCDDACPFAAIQKPVEAPGPPERARSKTRLALGLLALPLLVGLGAWGGGLLAMPFARMHPRVRLAERILLEDQGLVEGVTDASKAFRGTTEPVESLYADALGLTDRFAGGGRWLGGFLGLVVGIKLAWLAVQRRQTDWEADRAMCVACARCFQLCPVEHKRLKDKEKLVPKRFG